MSSLGDTLNHYKYWILGAMALVLLYQMVPRDNRPSFPTVDEAVFQAEVANDTQPVLVKFGATWCGPCRMMDKSLAEFQKSSEGKVKVIALDVDQNPGLAQKYGVSSIPHSFVFFQGKVLASQVGYMDAGEIQSWVTVSSEKAL